MIQGDSLSPTFLHRDLEKTPLHHRRNPPPTTCPQNPCPIFLHGLTPVSSLLHPAQSVSSAGIWFFALGLPPRAHGSCLQAGSAADSSWWVFFFFFLMKPVQIFCVFSCWVFLLICKNSLHVLEISTFSDIWNASIFSHFVICPTNVNNKSNGNNLNGQLKGTS